MRVLSVYAQLPKIENDPDFGRRFVLHQARRATGAQMAIIDTYEEKATKDRFSVIAHARVLCDVAQKAGLT